MPITWTAGTNPPGFDPKTVRRLKYPKGPSDLMPVTGDFRGVLAAIDCDSLSTTFTPVITITRNDGTTSDLILVGVPALNPDSTRVTVWLAQGSVGFEYLVSITVHSVDDMIITRSFIVPVNYR